MGPILLKMTAVGAGVQLGVTDKQIVVRSLVLGGPAALRYRYQAIMRNTRSDLRL